MITKKRLGDVLVDLGFISEEQLQSALDIQATSDKRLGEILLDQNLLSRDQLSTVLEFQLGIPYVDLSTYNIDPKASKLISEKLARKHDVLPVAVHNDKIVVVMADPFDIVARDDVKIASNLETEVLMSSKEDIRKSINTVYDSSEITDQTIEELNIENADYDEIAEDIDNIEVEKAPVVRLVNTIISGAIKARASDIHIEAYEKTAKVRYRVDGELKDVISPPKSSHQAIVARIKILGGMDIAEKRIPQDGRIETVIEGKPIDMRISVLPTVHGEKAVIRLLDRSSIVLKKEDLGFTEYNINLFNRIIKSPEGIILLTGPTGSGKTTTLYATLSELNKPNINVITVEDPVEYRLEGVNQVQVNTKAGLTFASGLRSILRQDPDIVMVGEIRDSETAQIATQAAITGHLVLSTIHTNDAVSTIFRLTDMGIETFMVSSAVVGVIAQRLVKRVCIHCKEKRPPTFEEMMMLGLEKPVFLYKGKGCNVCGGSGYYGRIAIHEVLAVDKTIRNMISKGMDADTIKEEAMRSGMKTLSESCKELVLEGVTTIEEMLKVTYSIDN